MDPELATCWRIFQRALEVRYVEGPDDLRQIQSVVLGESRYSDIGFQELMIERQGPRVRVSLLEDSATCSAAAFAAALEKLGSDSAK